MDIVKEDNDGISNTIFAALKQELCLLSWSNIIYCDVSWSAERVRYMTCQVIGNIRIPIQNTFVAHCCGWCTQCILHNIHMFYDLKVVQLLNKYLYKNLNKYWFSFLWEIWITFSFRKIRGRRHTASMGWFMKKYQRIVEEKERARADEQASSSFDLANF